jgi:hypothetical protein
MAGISKQQILILTLLLFFTVAIVGCFILIAAEKIVPF